MKDSHSQLNDRFTYTSYPSDPLRQRIYGYFVPLAQQMERLLLLIIICLMISLVLAQAFILSKEEHQELVNKAVRYEGVFREDQIEIRATLQRR
ncbi:hypothetical protein J2S00_000534 [Caldalkalibacillus uzonensis]|uniref:Uncharacterized protein n=1 Tax=Caldalkalibacillus uzonensis TaxID=353224 RepID=A0ABU0CMX1_9BACI|nr:DUF5359 family protein [Caldalkalibacillus uzonensis]MDQ0337764.1 hypothetical protein [Caldalkalibacillus uzonensis]